MSRPWEEAPLRSWETQQPIYPRTISIHRPNILTGVGIVVGGYSAVTEGNEAVVASGLPASIQQTREPGLPEFHTPSDAPNRSVWNIFVPASAAAMGTITERDVIIDDLGKRYVTIAAYWNSLGHRLRCELLDSPYVPPPVSGTSLDFSNSQNSQYLVLTEDI